MVDETNDKGGKQMAYNFESRQKLQEQFLQEWNKQLGYLSKDEKEQVSQMSIIGTYYDSGKLREEAVKRCQEENTSTLSCIVNKYYKKLLEIYIRKEDRENYLYIIDKLNQFPYTKGYGRRTVRTKKYLPSINHMFLLLKDYRMLSFYNCTVAEFIANKLSEERLDYKRNSIYSNDLSWNYLDDLIAACIDKEDKEVIEEIKDMILSDTNTSVITTDIIRGIVKSSNRELHQLLADFLLAARLSEGIRQAICENADCGTREAFITIFDTICSHGLIRFSSIKRAIAVWVGVCDEEQADRITEKMLELMKQSLHNSDIVKEYLETNDSIKICIGLWTLGTIEVQDAIDAMKVYLEHGTRNQILTMSYFNRTLEWSSFTEIAAKEAILKYPDDFEVIAAFMPTYLSETHRYVSEIVNFYDNRNKQEKTLKEIPLSHLFAEEEEAREHYSILKQILQTMNKKIMEFSPFIFPWYSVWLTKSDIIRRMSLIAWLLKDNSYMEEMAEQLSLLDSNGYSMRASYLILLLSKPTNDKQKKILLNYMVDKETMTREAAFEIVKGLTLTESDYCLLEGFLKYKRGDIRRNVLTLLGKQNDKDLLQSAKRLLSNSKKEIKDGGLSLVVDAKKSGRDKELLKKLSKEVEHLKNISDKEQILIDEILKEQEDDLEEGYGLYDPSYTPVYPAYEGNKKQAKEYFKITKKQLDHLYKALNDLVEKNAGLQYTTYFGNEVLLGQELSKKVYDNSIAYEDCYPFKELWVEFYEQEIKDVRILYILSLLWGNGLELWNRNGTIRNKERIFDWEKKLLGKTVSEYRIPEYSYTKQGQHSIVYRILDILSYIYMDEDFDSIWNTALEFVHQINENVPEEDLWYEIEWEQYNYNNDKFYALTDLTIFKDIIHILKQWDEWEEEDKFKESFFALYRLDNKFKYNSHKNIKDSRYNYRNYESNWLRTFDYIKAWTMDLIPKEAVCQAIFELIGLSNSLRDLSLLVKDSLTSYDKNYLSKFIKEEELTEDLLHLDHPFAAAGREIYFELTDKILDTELKRGEMATKFSDCIHSIGRIFGVERLIDILKALGDEKLDRSSYYYYWRDNTGRRECFSYLLQNCYPNDDDTAEKMKQQMKGSKIKEQKLIETIMYAPQWISIIEEYLDWSGLRSGCYYFMAHMNEWFDERKKAMIARFTPLTVEELNLGAFDVNWFQEAYHALGEQRFQQLYDAAKYISDGSKHARARKYADAALGKVSPEELEALIEDKRNKDLLMSYGLVPIKNKQDVVRRYEFVQKFLKESKQFGAQRRASEAAAVAMALKNMANTSGYADVTRLTLAMESELIKTYKQYFDDHDVEDINIKLVTDENGKTKVVCSKAGKTLKSIPAKIKKTEYVIKLKEVEKKLKEQYKRTVKMMEQSMEDKEAYQYGELLLLLDNPVIKPIITSLVFIGIKDSSIHGFIGKKGISDCYGEEHKLRKNTLVRVAHPFDLYKIECWHDYQKHLFFSRADNKVMKQPFKQVFRELYVKLPEEFEKERSSMYAGNQIQPAKTLACLKQRRWIADYEEGLQKVYYKENLIARIYELADWFSPGDIEAPTLEWVEFSDRKTFQPVKIKDVPEIVYSEVMRDVDMAVSVAHAGGVDPETSHSTVEMRKAILEFSLPLFHADNVALEGNFAHIKGTRGEYTIHLGSGMIHQLGGPQIHVLPVHSQGRGKLFLPFLDEDPKTAEIISKILLFAEDNKIKDPYILEQICILS